jgi:hypothetical protein
MQAPSNPRLIRYLAATIAGAAAAVYVLIAANVITVTEGQAAEAPVPPVVAALLLGAVAVLLVRTERRGVLIGGVGVQLFLIVFYFLVATERVPAFEAWGIVLKVAQGAVLALLAWLLLSRTNTGQPRTPVAPS